VKRKRMKERIGGGRMRGGIRDGGERSRMKKMRRTRGRGGRRIAGGGRRRYKGTFRGRKEGIREGDTDEEKDIGNKIRRIEEKEKE
jgi:hypothetical protein